jgi:hypothetical protein
MARNKWDVAGIGCMNDDPVFAYGSVWAMQCNASLFGVAALILGPWPRQAGASVDTHVYEKEDWSRQRV